MVEGFIEIELPSDGSPPHSLLSRLLQAPGHFQTPPEGIDVDFEFFICDVNLEGMEVCNVRHDDTCVVANTFKKSFETSSFHTPFFPASVG